MQHTPSHNDPFRAALHAIINNQPIPVVVAAQLEARGIDVGALEIRIKQSSQH